MLSSRAATWGGAPRAMMQASLASEGVRPNVFARIAAGGPGLGPKALRVRMARKSWEAEAELRQQGQILMITGSLSCRWTITGSETKGLMRVDVRRFSRASL